MPDPAPSAPAFRPLPDPPPPWRRALDAALPWLRRVRQRPRGTAVLLGAALAVVLAVVVVVRGMPGAAARPTLTLPSASHASSTASGSASGATPAPAGASPAVATTVVVDVAGAVAHPALYRLAPGARVDDAVTAAGGPAPDADLDAVNLASPVADGDRVYVPHRGDPSDPGATGTSVPQILSLNSATAAALDTLPGVGPSLASAIVEYRRQHGPFRAVDDLLQVPGVGPAKLAALRPHLRL